MRIITAQQRVSIPVVMGKVGETYHKIGVNLLSPRYGVCVDGHHGYMASLIDHKPLRIVTLSNKRFSNGLTGAGLLDYWMVEAGGIAGEWVFYDLLTGHSIDPRVLKAVVDQFPDYCWEG